jgi:hypothetical protein
VYFCFDLAKFGCVCVSQLRARAFIEKANLTVSVPAPKLVCLAPIPAILPSLTLLLHSAQRSLQWEGVLLNFLICWPTTRSRCPRTMDSWPLSVVTYVDPLFLLETNTDVNIPPHILCISRLGSTYGGELQSQFLVLSLCSSLSHKLYNLCSFTGPSVLVLNGAT